jgi:hypothetical protein
MWQFAKSSPSHFRYRQVPTFGRGTIRRFSSNASAMKRLAARDFEDLLQVSALTRSRLSSNVCLVCDAGF